MELKMKQLIEVEIPDGDYCIDRTNNIWCDYVNDATVGDGMLCSLILSHNDECLVCWDDNYRYEKATKCKKCLSFKL